jgi:GWxTD domain-containing protein
MKKFKKLEIAWEQFWKDKDPTPNTEFNEEKEKFLENFQYAVSKFLGRNNKINIMGLIYIKYGSPDYIERGELNFDSKNYEIWYYENINRKFIFIDKYGTGEYDLVPPSLYNDF